MYLPEPDAVEDLRFRNRPGMIGHEFPLEVMKEARVGGGESGHCISRTDD